MAGNNPNLAEDSIAVANEFIRQSVARNIPPTPMKLQKLIYFAHGWHLAIKDAPLVDETFQAWPYGPVLPSVYHEFRSYGSRPIFREAFRLYQVDERDFAVAAVFLARENEERVRSLVTRMLEIYGGWTAGQLSAETHRDDGPWHAACAGRDPGLVHGIVIPNDSIKEFFMGKLDGGGQ